MFKSSHVIINVQRMFIDTSTILKARRPLAKYHSPFLPFENKVYTRQNSHLTIFLISMTLKLPKFQYYLFPYLNYIIYHIYKRHTSIINVRN